MPCSATSLGSERSCESIRAAHLWNGMEQVSEMGENVKLIAKKFDWLSQRVYTGLEHMTVAELLSFTVRCAHQILLGERCDRRR